MHNKFKELADKAGANTDTSGRWVYVDGFEKFAELVVKECHEVALNSSGRNDDMAAIIATKIKQHFGIE